MILIFGRMVKHLTMQGKNVDPDFRMRIRMTQSPWLLFPASAESRNFAFKIQAY